MSIFTYGLAYVLLKPSHAADLKLKAVRRHSSTTVVPAAWVHIGENSDHVIPQSVRLEGGGDEDVAALLQRASHEHRPSVDEGRRLHTLLGQDVVHPVLPV